MSESNFPESSEDELLSAYVDGELTDAERTAVEQRLRDDPQARQLVADLRDVSQSLRSLPRLELGADLREAVLQRSVDNTVRPADTDGGTRRWVWAAMALAAALLLTVYLPEANRDEQPLAQAPRRVLAPLAELKEEPKDSPSLVDAERENFEVGLLVESLSPRLPGTLEDGAELGVRADQYDAADRVALGGGIAGALRTAPIESPQLQPIGELPAEDYHIHLAAVDRRVGVAQFDQLLVSNGIEVEDDQNASVDARSSGMGGDGEMEQGELVLVEAPLEQIQQIIASCSGEDSSWKTLRLIGPDGADTGLLLAGQKTEDRAHAKAGVPMAAGIPQVAESADRIAHGTAVHLGQERLVLGELKKNEGDSSRKQRMVTLDSSAEDEKTDADQQTKAKLRVLFFLHPNAD